MAGHNKWTQIKRQKGATDAKKSKIFSKLSRNISMEAKLSHGADSPALKAAIEKARKMNMPKDVIERAIKKGGEPSADMENIMYEAYGPGGVGILVETLTDNRNRTAQEIKHIFTKNEFSLGGIGSVVWGFEKESTGEGMIWKPTITIPLSEEDLALLEKLVDDLEECDDVQEVFTNAE
ncbi:MAG TPA: YebC/PmpR family DNA-binding transcriptional regulator [Candidatus Paceibacterota bacterium]|nr:YebC/PmpR family DNA-binding transcriptional regulator [Candidatus Paceibacterota bacterium]